MSRFLITMAFALSLAGCGGTYVDDSRNFERAFGAKCPSDLRVEHSVYVQTPHFTEEHMYYFEMIPITTSAMPKWVTNAPGIMRATNEMAEIPWQFAPRDDRPKWFAPGNSDQYEVWYRTNGSYVVLRDKQAGNVFVYGSFGM